MNKTAGTIVLLTTLLLTTACTNPNGELQKPKVISSPKEGTTVTNDVNNLNNSTVTFPIELVSKDRQEVVFVEINKESTLQEKVELIVKTMSKEAFNGLPIHVTIYANEMAKVVLKEFSDSSENNRFSWKKDYLSKNNEERTINTLVKNILQEEYEGPWIKTVQLYYEDELITLD